MPSKLNDFHVTVPVRAGLGNQLFQYAAGLAFARRHARALVLDRSWYAIQRYRPRREFLLDRFMIPEAVSRRGRAFGDPRVVFALLKNRFRAHTPPEFRFLGLRFLNEGDVHRKDPRLHAPQPPGNIALMGYWQTVDHFLAVSRELRATLKPRAEMREEGRAWKAKIDASHSVFVHVRRGDFVTLGHPVLTPAYYSAAARLLGSLGISSPRWFVFSDDGAWCAKNLTLPGPVEFVHLEGAAGMIEEMLLMAACRAGIIANSSFSWWGAALGERPDRPVVAPKYRCGRGLGDIQAERVLPTWHLVE